MEKAEVFFTDFRVREDGGIEKKLKWLLKTAGIKKIDFDGKFVAIKMHFGEDGNMSFLRPDYARAVAEVLPLGELPLGIAVHLHQHRQYSRMSAH